MLLNGTGTSPVSFRTYLYILTWKPRKPRVTLEWSVRQHRSDPIEYNRMVNASPGSDGRDVSSSVKETPLALRPLFRVKRCKVYTTASSSVRFLILGRAPASFPGGTPAENTAKLYQPYLRRWAVAVTYNSPLLIATSTVHYNALSSCYLIWRSFNR